MPLVGAVLDLAANPLPVRLVGVVLLEEHLEAVPQRGVADLLPPEHVEASIDVLAHDARLDPLDPHEILLVERAKAIEGSLELADQLLDFALVHGPATSLLTPLLRRPAARAGQHVKATA
jgi:hypothetical protein